MHLTHIPLDKLSVAAINMRHSKKTPDLGDILPAVRARGILVPLLVRPNGSSDSFEIVAGRRRYYAAKAVAEDNGQAFDVPCAIIEAGDDAAALEASLIENIAREAPHEVELWESFAELVRQGRSAEEIGLTFGLNARQVGQVLALGGLLPKIRDLYCKEQIDAASIRLLTMASKAQQKEWLALALDPKGHAPSGQRLKAWLFGGASIPASHAIFELETYTGEIVTDLFGEERYFASADAFWEAQHAAIAVKRKTYLEAGWSDVVVVEPGCYFHTWAYEKTPRKKGGKVFITLSPRGEVAFHEGYLTRAEARRRASGDGDGGEARPVRPELTGPLQNYGDLHRHAAVRTAGGASAGWDKIDAGDGKGLESAIGLARQSLNEVKAQTEYQDQKAGRLLTVSTILSALAGLLFQRFNDGYPLQATLASDGGAKFLVIAAYLAFVAFILAVLFGAIVTFHATRTRFKYDATEKPAANSDAPKSRLFYNPILRVRPRAWVESFVTKGSGEAGALVLNGKLPKLYFADLVVETYLIAAKTADKIRYLEEAQRLFAWALRSLLFWLFLFAVVSVFVSSTAPQARPTRVEIVPDNRQSETIVRIDQQRPLEVSASVRQSAGQPAAE